MRSRAYLREAGLLKRPPRLTPMNPREQWHGRVVALDTEGSADTGKFTATARWDDIIDNGASQTERFTEPEDFAEFLIEMVNLDRSPILFYFHNLEWDLQVIWRWLGDKTRLRYVGHTARRSGSALTATFDYEGRPAGRRKILLQDSFAIWPLSLKRLGDVVGLPKLNTPSVYIPHGVDWRTGEKLEHIEEPNAEGPRCEHDLAECVRCYDLRDVEILHKAMRLYVDECNAANVKPALTRSAHAMRDFRTNHLARPMMQYTERENLRALAARYGGRSQMLAPGLTVAKDDHVIVQLDVVSEYPSIMVKGKFPDAGMHHIINRPRTSRVNEYVGYAWATVTIPDLPIGPLVYRHENGRTTYPVNATIQGAWTTDELAYALELGCTMDLARIEGTPLHAACDPFSSFVNAKIEKRLEYKAAGNPLHEAEKLSLNGLSGKFGMRWTDAMVEFVAADPDNVYQFMSGAPCQRADKLPKRFPDYIMVPWSALIMARGRIMLHRFGMDIVKAGGKLLCCDTDSWTADISRDALATLPLGKKLGQWECECEYVAFRGAAPKEYALYKDSAELFEGNPSKARAKGIGGIAGADRGPAIDHYLRTGNIHFQRPHKTRSVMRGARGASFVAIEKTRHHHPEPTLPPVRSSYAFSQHIREHILRAESDSLWAKKNPTGACLPVGSVGGIVGVS